jgi:nucleoside-diphosphate-sugar epimerase
MEINNNMKAGLMHIGVIGASGLVGRYLLPLLVDAGYVVNAFSRKNAYSREESERRNVIWRLLSAPLESDTGEITKWIFLAPIVALPEYFPMLLQTGTQHVVVVSSTSRFTKEASSDKAERELVKNIADGEKSLIAWADENKINWTILRPTLIYSLGYDKNISVIARFIRRFSFFPLAGEAKGLRQPVHARDVALACIAALNTEKTFNRSYNISGGETLTYRQMVEKVFESLGKKPHFVVMPLWIFRAVIFFLRVLPRFRHWSAAMAERMNQNLIFDHQEATNDFGFAPRKFELIAKASSKNLIY